MCQTPFKRMHTIIVFKLFLVLLSRSSLSAPLNTTMTYDAFLKNITDEHCAFPSGIVLPFKEQAATLQFLSVPLKICKAPDALRRSLEAVRLCNEIYASLRNITCHLDKSVQLPEIKIEFSDNVCQDINALKIQSGLLQHLTDKFVCDMMCDDDFLPACKVLLWSYQLQKQIADIPPVQNQNIPVGEIANVAHDDRKTNVSPVQENTDIEQAPSSINKTLIKINQGDLALNNKQPNQDVSGIKNPDSNGKINEAEQSVNDEEQTVNDDAVKNYLSHAEKTNEDQRNIDEENEIPDKTVKIKSGDVQKEKQDQSLKLDEQNELLQVENEVPIAKKDAMETKELTTVANKTSNKENKIDSVVKPPKNPLLSDSGKTVLENKPVVTIPEQTKVVINQTELKNNTLSANSQTKQEKAVNVKTTDTLTSPNIQKPVIPEQNDDLKEKVPSPVIPKTSPSDVNEAKVLIKPEVTLSEVNEIPDTKLIPAIGQEDAFASTTVADLEKMEDGNPEPADKEPDLYNDLGSDGDYSKLYDEDGIYESSKNKKTEKSDSGKISKPALAENESPKYDVFPQRNSFIRPDEDIAVPFPEQEDSHFFFYFLSLVLVLMAGYVLFHNKQKIIALIVEGRHERRRRSHGVGYKKLETK